MWSLVLIAAIVVLGGRGTAAAQEQAEKKQVQTVPPPNANAAPERREPRVVPLKIQVVLAKFQGEKKVSSMPYVLSLATGQPRVSLRMGGEIPIATSAGFGNTPTAFNYRPVGTNIDCFATALDEGRYSVNIGLEDSSVYSEDQEVRGLSKAGSDQPSFNTFKVNETVILKDGESSQFTTATDKISGQVIKVDLTLTVLK